MSRLAIRNGLFATKDIVSCQFDFDGDPLLSFGFDLGVFPANPSIPVINADGLGDGIPEPLAAERKVVRIEGAMSE